MQKKYVKRVGIVLTSITIGLLGVMLFHIYQVTTPKSDGYINTSLQLARIDFSRKLNEHECSHLAKFFTSTPGISSYHINAKDNIAVFVFDNRRSKQILEFMGIPSTLSVGEGVAQTLTNSGILTNDIQASLYHVEPTLTGSCPIDGQQLSLYRSLGKFMHDIFG